MKGKKIRGAKIPSKIEINDNQYSVEQKKNLHCFRKLNRRKKKQLLYGIVDFNNRQIKLDKKLSPREQVSTLWHELIHSVIHEFELPIDKRSEERLVLGLEEALMDLFENNPRLLIWTLYKIGNL